MYIDQLPNLPSADGTELIPVSQNGVDFAVTIRKLLEFWTLLNGVGAGAGTVSTYNSRAISNYKIIVAEWLVNNAIRATAFCRKDSFVAATNLSLFYVDSGNTQRYCEISYVSNNSVKLTASGNATGAIFLYGI